MKRVIHSVAALVTALFAVLLCASAAQSGELTQRDKPDLASMADNAQHAALMMGNRAGTNPLRATLEYSLTRIATITVGNAVAVPPSAGLSSRWQVECISQQFLSGRFDLPHDASAITVTVINGAYGIDYSGPTIYITSSQGVYYEYHTDQQVQRFGNQFLISQTY